MEGPFVRRPDVLWRESLGEVIVLGVDGDGPLVLTGTATTIWQLLVDPMSFDELIDFLADAFEAEPSVIANDIEPVLRRLVGAGVISSG